MKKARIFLYLVLFIFLLVLPSTLPVYLNYNQRLPPTVEINVEPYSTIYEGEIIECNISGEPRAKYCQINSNGKYTMFYGDNPIIFDPTPTPLNQTFVNLSVYAENRFGNDSETVPIKLKRIFFGDIHWHTDISDGDYDIDTMYTNAFRDNYLDFASCTDHAELIRGKNQKSHRILKTATCWDNEWEVIKAKAIEYNEPGDFTTLLGFEWSAGQATPGGWRWSPYAWEDGGHINFYYKDVYEDASAYSALQKINYEEIFQVMDNEWEKGHLNIGFPHHPLGETRAMHLSFTTNWTYLIEQMDSQRQRSKILRGAEIYSRWGTSIGQFYTPDVPWMRPYDENQFHNQTESWIENALWELADKSMEEQRFAFIASSDTHHYDRPGSALYEKSHLPNPSGIVAVYALHNTREEIWNGLNNCRCYALQLQKMRVNTHFEDKTVTAGWINCTPPLEIEVTAYATFPGLDRSGKSMCPQGYSPASLDYALSDIWLVKNDRERGKPWCKVIGHRSPKGSLAISTFSDPNVKPNDFYWILIRQEKISSPNEKGYGAFIGPIFIEDVKKS